jgi:hypothetical protein
MVLSETSVRQEGATGVLSYIQCSCCPVSAVAFDSVRLEGLCGTRITALMRAASSSTLCRFADLFNLDVFFFILITETDSPTHSFRLIGRLPYLHRLLALPTVELDDLVVLRRQAELHTDVLPVDQGDV